MKKTILFFTLLLITQTHQILSMESYTQRQKNFRSTWTIFTYLNWHNYSGHRDINMCEEVEKLIKAGVDVNQKETNMASPLYDMTPLAVAITTAKCKKCENLLKQHGAKETELIQNWREHYSNEETT